MFADRVAAIRQTRARRPEMVAQAAAKRKRAPAFPGRLVLIAADHTARGILRAAGARPPWRTAPACSSGCAWR